MKKRTLWPSLACVAASVLFLLPGSYSTAKGSGAFFSPSNRLSGIGASRAEISAELLRRRTELMVESQTFAILRDPRAIAGAERINSPENRRLFEQAGEQSGLSPSLIAAVAYLESFGDPQAQSPAGPKGMMQIAAATARSMGLRITYAKRYRVVTERKAIKGKKGKVTYKNVKRRIPYTVLASDERLNPRKAVPAAARYLARLTNKFGGEDWAVFAYHCGEGCVGDVLGITERADGLPKPVTVPAMFFGASPARNRELYESVQYHMERDFSPTYYFRVLRAQQLLELYRKDKAAFLKLAEDYRNEVEPDRRAPHRLSVWLKPQDLTFQSCDDVKRELGRSLARAFDNPRFFGFDLGKASSNASLWDEPGNREYYLSASPAAIGTLTYIAFETRRMHEAMKPKGERFVPLDVSALVRTAASVPKDDMPRKSEASAHCSGQVFDIDYSSMPAGQRQALRFVLDDMGWMGYLGFVEETPNSGTLHIGCSPTSREFFLKIFEEASATARS